MKLQTGFEQNITLKPVLYLRNYSDIIFTGGYVFNVDEMTWNALGGPKGAAIGVSAELTDLWELVEWLRCPIEIHSQSGILPYYSDEYSQLAWFGYVHEIELNTGKLQLRISLDRMTNKVRVTYSLITGAGVIGEQTTTAYSEDTQSSGEYGTKMGTFNLGEMNAEEAANRVATLLARYKYPVPSIQVGDAQPGGRLICRGWWGTLGWKTYSSDAGKESYETIGVGLQNMGNVAANTKVAQSFQLAGSVAWSADKVKIRCKKEGAPGDSIKVEICSDSAGSPGTSLANGTITGANTAQYLNWHEFTLNVKVALSPSTTYWVVVSRTSTLDAANYYKIDTNEALGYTRGSFKIYGGATWVARSPDADMLFIVLGVRETSQQISDIVTSAGQFFTGIDIDNASGVYSSPYRDGTKTALEIVTELMKSGTTNNRRLLATVTPGRRLRVYEEPAIGANDFYLNADGEMQNAQGQFIAPEMYRPGVWAILREVVPGNADVTKLADISKIFIDEVVYRNGKSYIVARDANDLMELTG